MDRTTALWSLVAFFGATIAFGYARSATKGASGAVAFGVQLLVLAVVIGLVVAIARRRR